MSGHWKKTCAALAALALVACSVVGTWKAVANLPGIFDDPPDFDEEDPNITWWAHGGEAAYVLGFLLLVIIYVAKRGITRFAQSVPAAIGWYCLAVICSLPYIWFFVVLDWQNPHIFRVSCWVYDPIAIWAVPTASFAWDVARPPWSCQLYVLRSFFEVVVIAPVWIVIWVYLSFFFLGGGWI